MFETDPSPQCVRLTPTVYTSTLSSFYNFWALEELKLRLSVLSSFPNMFLVFGIEYKRSPDNCHHWIFSLFWKIYALSFLKLYWKANNCGRCRGFYYLTQTFKVPRFLDTPCNDLSIWPHMNAFSGHVSIVRRRNNTIFILDLKKLKCHWLWHIKQITQVLRKMQVEMNQEFIPILCK